MLSDLSLHDMKLFRDAADKFIAEYVRKTYRKIDVKSGGYMLNHKCHLNAVNYAVEKKESNIVLCVTLFNDEPNIHFINFTKYKYVDNTLGQWSATYDYYLVRFIAENEYYSIVDVFSKYRAELNRCLPWYLRLFGEYKF